MSLDDTGTLRLSHAGGLPWVVPARRHGPLARKAKRTLDLLLAPVLIVLTSPVLLSAMALIRLTSRGPALFVQPRVGFGCRTFRMYKLRTMVKGAERLEKVLAANKRGTFLKLEDDPRVTRLGSWLRRSSIDELPQLFNVLKGDMTLVGPRPLLLSDFRDYPKQAQMRRFSVPPGLTGLWQVSGRSSVDDEERVRLDLEYVDRWSFWLDLKLLLQTLPAVFSGDGAT